MNWDTHEGKEIFKWFRIALIVLAVFLAVEALSALKTFRNPEPAYNTISVQGTGEATAVPDIAEFSFAVTSDGKTVTEVQNQTTTKIDAILKKLKDAGIEDKDIKTTNYSVYPKYTYVSIACAQNYCPPSKQVPDGYTAEHSISVKVRKTDNAGTILGLVGDAGATNISSISFTLDDPEQPLKEARGKAIADAKGKANLLADQLGVRLVRVVSFEDSNTTPRIYETLGSAKAMDSQAASAPTLPTGENKSSVTVTVTYEIR